MLSVNQIIHGDCLEILPQVADKSIDLILADLPYNLTQAEWDLEIDLNKLWIQFRRIIKERGAIICMASGIFTGKLMMSAPDLFKYSLVWKKNKVTGWLNAKKMPMRAHEDILVFYKKLPKFNPQKTSGHKPVNSYTKNTSDGENYGATKLGIKGGGSTERYPTSIIEIPVVNNDNPNKKHSTEKPVELGEYLIKSYSEPGMTVLDPTCGSGAFLVAAKNLNRYWIGIELDSDMVKESRSRLDGTSK